MTLDNYKTINTFSLKNHMKIKYRNKTIDIAKAIGILAIVAGHNPAFSQGELYNILFSFHLPLFLFLSGAFLN
jgi:fucose 4-O-acetylase-like acetyltransferase